MKEQKVLNLSEDGYYNFFFTPGASDSLKGMVQRGWTLKFIKDDSTNRRAVAVFEKHLKCPRCGKEPWECECAFD